MIKSVFNTINIPVPRKPDFSSQMQILNLTDKLATIGDFFLNFCVTISNSPPSFIRIKLYFNIYGLFYVCQNQITYYTQRLRTLYNRKKVSFLPQNEIFWAQSQCSKCSEKTLLGLPQRPISGRNKKFKMVEHWLDIWYLRHIYTDSNQYF